MVKKMKILVVKFGTTQYWEIIRLMNEKIIHMFVDKGIATIIIDNDN